MGETDNNIILSQPNEIAIDETGIYELIFYGNVYCQGVNQLVSIFLLQNGNVIQYKGTKKYITIADVLDQIFFSTNINVQAGDTVSIAFASSSVSTRLVTTEDIYTNSVSGNKDILYPAYELSIKKVS